MSPKPRASVAGIGGPFLEEAERILHQLAGTGAWLDRPTAERLPVEPALPSGDGGNGQEKLQRAEARYRTLVEQLPAVTFMASLEGGINELYVSPQIERLLGFSQKEWLEDPVLWYRQLHPDDRVRWHTEFALTCAAGKHFHAEYRFLARDGRVVWVHGEAQVVRDAWGMPIYLQGIAFDITARKQAEESLRRAHEELERRVTERTAELARANEALTQEVRQRTTMESELRRVNGDLVTAHERAVEANQVKSTFLANMSHELRTPLNAIIGYSELLQELAAKKIAKDPAPDLEKINRAGKHLMAIINDILDISKIEAGKMQLVAEYFSVADLLRDVETTISPLLAKNGNTLEIQSKPGVGTMHTDVTRVRQCLLNLLSNACKFSKNNVIRLDLEREARLSGDWLVFQVRDQGIGMTPDQVSRLFQPFTQADASTTRKYGGTGLGLAITKKICEMMGGDIAAQSAVGEGSTFTLQLPASLPPPPAEVEPVAPQAEVPAATAPVEVSPDLPTVLVIDDDPTVHDLMTRYLSCEGFAVVHASGGREGLRLAHEIRPVAITLDVMMPEMDGWSTLSALKADPELVSIPVILVTIVDDRGRGFAMGASDYLPKPIDRNRLIGVLGKRLNPGAGRSVLLIEDDEDSRRLLSRVLRQDGWKVREAPHGRIGLERVAEETPGLILLDLMMPEMDGFTFLKEMRKVEAWRSIPVVFVTAKDLTREDLRQLEEFGDPVVRKDGFDNEGLLKTVVDLLKGIARPPRLGMS